MRIGITCYPTYGGSGIIATELGKRLAERGHEVHFITSALPYRLRTDMSPRLFFHEVEKVNYPLFEASPYILLLASKMADIAATHKLDVLHVHYAIPHAVSGLLAQSLMGRKAPKLITTLHGTDVTLIGAMKSLEGMTRHAIDRSDGVTAVSSFLADKTREVFGTRREIRVIPNFYSPAEFNPRVRKCPCITPKKRARERFIIHMSNFRPLKRIPDTLQVFRGIASQIPARLLLVGDGPEIYAAKELVREYGLEGKVLFLGLVEHVGPLLAVSDLLLQVSEYESFGLASLEALACGVPVIATSGSGLSEVVCEGKNGHLSAPGDVGKMARDGLSILLDKAKWKRFSAHGAAWTRRLFADSKVIPAYESYYREVVKG